MYIASANTCFWNACSNFQTIPYGSKKAEMFKFLVKRRDKVVIQSWEGLGGLHSLFPSTEASLSDPDIVKQSMAGKPVHSSNKPSASIIQGSNTWETQKRLEGGKLLKASCVCLGKGPVMSTWGV